MFERRKPPRRPLVEGALDAPAPFILNFLFLGNGVGGVHDHYVSS